MGGQTVGAAMTPGFDEEQPQKRQAHQNFAGIQQEGTETRPEKRAPDTPEYSPDVRRQPQAAPVQEMEGGQQTGQLQNVIPDYQEKNMYGDDVDHLETELIIDDQSTQPMHTQGANLQGGAAMPDYFNEEPEEDAIDLYGDGPQATIPEDPEIGLEETLYGDGPNETGIEVQEGNLTQ